MVFEGQGDSIKRGVDLVQKVIALGQSLNDKVERVEAAADPTKSPNVDDLTKVHSQASSGDVCNVQDLKPAEMPPGKNRLARLKSEAERGQETCEQKAEAAKTTLAALTAAANASDTDTLVSTLQNLQVSQLAKLKQAKISCAEVLGDPDELKEMRDVLQAEGVAGSLSDTEQVEMHEKVTSRRAKDYFETCNQVANDLISPNALPLELGKIFAVLDEGEAVGQIGKKADEGQQEIVTLMEVLKKHLERIIEQRKLCKTRCTKAQENEKATLAKVEITLQTLKEQLREYLDALVTSEALGVAHVSLQIQEQSVTQEIEQATPVSVEAEAALTACSAKASELKAQIIKVTEETASGLKARALKPAAMALEGTEIALNILSRAEDQKTKQRLKTEQELVASERSLKEKKEAFNRGVGNGSEIAQMKTKVQEKSAALEEQKMELGQVQDSKEKAVKQHESFALLETVGYTFDKSQISERSQEIVKQNAGNFEMFRMLKEVPPGEMNASEPECTALSISHALIEKMIQEKIEERLANQEEYHRIEREEMREQNELLQEQNQELKAQLEELARAQSPRPAPHFKGSR